MIQDALRAWHESLPETRRKFFELAGALAELGGGDVDDPPDVSHVRRATELYDRGVEWDDAWFFAGCFESVEAAWPWLDAGWRVAEAASCANGTVGIETPERADEIMDARGLSVGDVESWTLNVGLFPWTDDCWTPEAQALMTEIRSLAAKMRAVR